MLVTYSNGQGAPLTKVLMTNPTFAQRYPSSHHIIIKDKKIPYEILQQATLFLYHPLPAIWGSFSTDTSVPENILATLPPSCLRISFPCIYSSAFSPFIPFTKEDEIAEDEREHPRPINIDVITELKLLGETWDRLYWLYENVGIDFRYQERHKNCLDVLRHKEEKAMVKIADFIEREARKQRLFLTQNQPTTTVYAECAQQVLAYLDLPKNLHLEELGINCSGVTPWPISLYDTLYWKFEYPISPEPKAYPYWRQQIQGILEYGPWGGKVTTVAPKVEWYGTECDVFIPRHIYFYQTQKCHAKFKHGVEEQCRLCSIPFSYVETLESVEDHPDILVWAPVGVLDLHELRHAKILVGPQIGPAQRSHTHHPTDFAKFPRTFCNTLCNYGKDYAPENWGKFEVPYCVLPYAVDTEKFKPSDQEKDLVVLMVKERAPQDVTLMVNWLKTHEKLTVKRFDYNGYREEDYLAALQRARYVVWVGRHEIQGYALEGALACGAPIFVWDVTSVHQNWIGDKFKHIEYLDRKMHATAIPYWSRYCGEHFAYPGKLAHTWELFQERLAAGYYNPRAFAMTFLSAPVCMAQLFQTFASCRDRTELPSSYDFIEIGAPSQVPKGTGIIAEPVPQIYHRVESQIPKESYSHVFLENIAITTAQGLCPFYVSKENPSVTPDVETPLQKIEVQGCSPSRLLDKYRVTKLDTLTINATRYVEEIIRAFPFRRLHPRRISFKTLQSSELIAILNKQGYEVCKEGRYTVLETSENTPATLQ